MSKLALILIPSAAQTAGEVTGTVPDTDVYSEALFVLDVTSLDRDATDTLDVYIDISPDNGITWINAVHFEQLDGNDPPAQTIARLEFDASVLATSSVANDAGAGAIRPIGLGTKIRYRGVVTEGAGAGPATFTYSLRVFFK